MINALDRNFTGQFYSVLQNSNYDSDVKENVFTTTLRISDNSLSVLSDSDKQELEEKILELVDHLNDEISLLNTNLMFDYEDSISSLIVKIKQRDSGEVIRQIPTDEALELMKHMRDIVSVILDTRG